MTTSALVGEFRLARLDLGQGLEPDVITRVRPALTAALQHTLRLPPLGLVADLCRLLDRTAPSLLRAHIPGMPLRRYDDRVVGPLLTDPRALAVQDAWASLPAAWRGVGVAVLAEQLADALEPHGPWWEAGELRRVLDMTDASGFAASGEAIADPGVRQVLSDRLDGLIEHGPYRWSEADVHLLRHVPVLVAREPRLAMRHVLEAADHFSRVLPRRVRARRRAGLVNTRIRDDDRYPTGGFSSLSRRGSFENLVASELVYMDDTGAPEPDLFDVRYVEGELLFYNRDESVHLRQRRWIHLVLDPSLNGLRVMDETLPFQRGILLCGLLVAVAQRVVKWLGAYDLRVHLHPLDGAWKAELELLRLALVDLEVAGVLQIVPLADGAEANRVIEEAAERAEVDAVWLGGEPPSAQDNALHVDVAAAQGPAWEEWATRLAAFLA